VKALSSIVLALLLGLASCAPNRGAAFPSAFAEAQRAESAGRYAEAAAKYDRAAEVAIRPRDRDHAHYVAGQLYLRAGNVREAIAHFEKIAAANPPTEHTAEAAFQVANARAEHGDPERGQRELEQVTARYPTSGVARAALRRVLAWKDEHEGPPATLAYLRKLDASDAGKSEIGELIAYQIADRLAKAGEDVQARDAYLSVAKRWPYPFGAYWDDSLFHASELDEKMGRYTEAIAHLERILAEYETTTIVGTYTRPRMSPALFRIGLLYRDRVGDKGKAKAAFHRLYTVFTNASRRDDALWYEADIWREEGDEATACSRLSTLVKEYPESRYVPCVVERCPSIARPAKSEAPKVCHPYLLRAGRVPN
jgi:TolA-binding protein